MIASLDGSVGAITLDSVVVEAGGVGYELRVPLSAHRHLAGRTRVALHVHTHVREDQIS